MNSYAATFEKVPVNLVRRVDFPTDGNPIMPTLASPDFDTSNPSYYAPPFFDAPSINSLFNFANLAFNNPKW